MKTTANTTANESKNLYVSFRWKNNRREFLGEQLFQELIARALNEDCMIINTRIENGEEVDLPADEWTLVDGGGNVILEGENEMVKNTGCLDFDGNYNKWYTTTAESMDEQELEMVYKAYLDGEYMSEDLKDYICEQMGVLRCKGIKVLPTELMVYTQRGTETVDFDGQQGEFSEDEWKDELEEQGFEPEAVKEIIDKLEMLEVIA